MGSKVNKRVRAFIFIFLLVSLVVGIRISGLQAYLDQERLRGWIGGFGAGGPIVYILIFSIAPSLFLPGLPITVAGGLVFGPLWGTAYASIGSTLGAGIAFLVARYFARNAISEMLGERWKKIDEGVTQKGWIYVAITRLIPIFPFNLLNYAFGLTKIPFLTYLLTSWLFMLPGTTAYVVFSSSLLDLLKGNASPAFLIGLVLLLLVSLAPFVYRRWKGLRGVTPLFIVSIGIAISVISVSSLAGTASNAGDGKALLLLTGEEGDSSLPKDWKPLTFPKIKNHTRYSLIKEDSRPVIKAESRQSASGLYRQFDLDPKIYPVLSWCWKVDRIIAKGDETRKDGDDYAARIYVTFKFDPDMASLWERTKFQAIKLIYGEYPPKAAINYIWANRLPKGKAIPNAYTERAQMVAVESGGDRVGQWICEERNLYDDYQKLFGDTPSAISGIAVMTDTDNTREEAIAYYADLMLRSPTKHDNNH